MAEVNVNINGRTFGIACDDGQEQRVLDLAKYVDERLQAISSAGAAGNDMHLMVLTSIVIADEVFDLLEGGGQEAAQASGNPEEDKKVVNAIDHLASRIDSIANSIQKIAYIPIYVALGAYNSI